MAHLPAGRRRMLNPGRIRRRARRRERSLRHVRPSVRGVRLCPRDVKPIGRSGCGEPLDRVGDRIRDDERLDQTADFKDPTDDRLWRRDREPAVRLQSVGDPDKGR